MDIVNTMQRVTRFLLLALVAAAVASCAAYVAVVTRRVGGNSELLAALRWSIEEERAGPFWVALALVAFVAVGSLVYVLSWRRK